jgi:hypothetical protein
MRNSLRIVILKFWSSHYFHIFCIHHNTSFPLFVAPDHPILHSQYCSSLLVLNMFVSFLEERNHRLNYLLIDPLNCWPTKFLVL